MSSSDIDMSDIIKDDISTNADNTIIPSPLVTTQLQLDYSPDSEASSPYYSGDDDSAEYDPPGPGPGVDRLFHMDDAFENADSRLPPAPFASNSIPPSPTTAQPPATASDSAPPAPPAAPASAPPANITAGTGPSTKPPSTSSRTGTTTKPTSKPTSSSKPAFTSKTAVGAPSTAASTTATTTTKPPRSARRAPPSPSPPPPPRRPPLQTVRLEIKLGGPDNYEVDIASAARAAGLFLRPPSPPLPAKRDTSDDSDADADVEPAADADAEGLRTRSRTRPKKKKRGEEYYDTNDPFIDDSELALDQRQYFAQTKHQGFYVSSGEVALMKDNTITTPKKPRSKKHPPVFPNSTPGAGAGTTSTAGAGPSSRPPGTPTNKHLSAARGTKDAPIPLTSDDERPVAGPSSLTPATALAHIVGPAATVAAALATALAANGAANVLAHTDVGAGAGAATGERRYVTVVEGGKKKRVVDITSFHPELQASLAELKQAVAKEDWSVKGKFPPAMKPLLARVALHAVDLGEYDEHFFNLMPSLFPYNRYTMTKLIKRTIYAEHHQRLVHRQEALLEELAAVAQDGFVRAQEEWEKSVALWERRQEERQRATEAESDAGAGAGTGASADAPTAMVVEDAGSGMDVDVREVVPAAAAAAPGSGSAGAHPPQKKYRLTERLKAILWNLVCLSNECCRMENENNTFMGLSVQVSGQGLRKVLYQKIVAAFPEGWMSTSQISRDVSAMKKKLEKEMMEQEVL